MLFLFSGADHLTTQIYTGINVELTPNDTVIINSNHVERPRRCVNWIIIMDELVNSKCGAGKKMIG